MASGAAAESQLTNNYTKGEIIVVDGKPEDEFPGLPENTIYIKVKRGSRIRNLIGFAIKMQKYKNNRHMVFTGIGDAIEKTITCAEIAKKKYKNQHQITKIGYTRIEEFWEPKEDSTLDLDRLKVTREIPMINILLCKDPLDANQPGYQAPYDYGTGVMVQKKRKWNDGRPHVRHIVDTSSKSQPTSSKCAESIKTEVDSADA